MPRGYHHTEETKAKLRAINLGNKHGLGRIVSKETRAKMSKAQMGKHHSEEARAKISKAQMGRVASEETRVKMGKARRRYLNSPAGKVARIETGRRMSGKQYALGYRHTEGTKEIIRLAGIGRVHPCSEETKARLRVANLGKHHTEESKARMGQKGKTHPMYGKHHTEEAKAKVSRANLGSHLSEETKANMSRSLVFRWQNPEFKARAVKAMMLASFRRPNKPETYLGELLESQYPGGWKYVGDGQLILAGKNPDFMNINGKKQVIEIYGDYWHRGEDPQERIDLFSQYGYDTLIVWEKELKDEAGLIQRIREFAR